MYFLNSFFVYSIIGYIMEIIVGFIIGANNPKSGILYGPWTPIYGFSSVLIILIGDNLFKKLHLSRWKEIIIFFLIIVFVLMGIEYLGGYLIEIIFGFSFWDYSNYLFHIGKYTCLEMGVIWGILGVLFIYFFRPFFDKYIRKIPSGVSALLLVLIFFDLIVRILKEIQVF